MNAYAIIDSGVVVNTILHDPATVAADFPGAIQIDTITPQPGIGWTYSGGVFTAPSPVTPPAPDNPVYARKDFMNLFTLTELTNAFAYQDAPNLSALQKAQLNVFFEYFRATEPVSLGDPATIMGVNMLESLGFLGTGRAAQILASRH